MNPKQAKIVLGSVAALFSAWIIVAPLLIDCGIATNLDGRVGMIEHGDLWNSMNPVSGIIYWLGDLFCHQEEARTFMLNGNELPFCTRDISIFVSVAIGFFAVLATGMKRNRKTDFFVGISFLLIIADWAIQRIFVLNVLPTRILTGALAGIAISFVLSFMLDYYLGYGEKEKGI